MTKRSVWLPHVFLMLTSLVLLAPGPTRAASIEVEIDASATGTPIDPLIYGQFIEHLGRSIYGGIWAEMLEDRKFYFPVNDVYAPYTALQDTDFPVVGASPWQIVGGPASVRMVREDPFVGEHSPLILEGSGIRQLDLGVRDGLGYEGYLWARPLGDAAAEVEITLAWGDTNDRSTVRLFFPPGDWSRSTFGFTAGATVERGATFDIQAVAGDLLVGTVSLMPADNLDGLRADTFALLERLSATVYRWPGGNFVSGYNWRDGIGDRDRRPPRKNPAWSGVEPNDFGTDEFLAFCRALGAEPMIAVNTGFGDAYSAAQWVEYTNAGTGTLGGGWRAANGHPEAWGVRYWSVGNEMFGHWQLGFMQLHQYVLKHNEVAKEMWRVDPELVLIGVGDLDGIDANYDPQRQERGITWSQGMLEASAEYMDLISEHIYVGRTPWTDTGRLPLAEHVAALKTAIRRKAEGHRELQASLDNLAGRIVPIAMDEWNYWHRDYVFGDLGCRYDLADGLGIAAGLHEFYRQADIIEMAHYAQTVNVIGAIKTTRIAAGMETTGLAFQMYREHFGSESLRLGDAPAPYDVVAALALDHRTLTLGVVNPTTAPVEIVPILEGAQMTGTTTRWHLTGADEFAFNTPGQPRAVDIYETRNLPIDQPLPVPALSAAIFAVPLDH